VGLRTAFTRAKINALRRKFYEGRRANAKLEGRAGRLRSTSALDASFSQRSCSILQLAMTSGELAILARRAQSAA
jgi:hypothetical protein